jgi:hypothetical protein
MRRYPAQPGEVDYIAGLVFDGVPLVYDALQNVLRPKGVNVSVCGVFCHQSPEVDLPNGDACELGDLLVVYVQTLANGRRMGNALLLQAKKTTTNSFKVPTSGQAQLDLYRFWPRFNYRGGFLGNAGRDVRPSAPHPGGQYLLIDAAHASWPGSPGRSSTSILHPLACCPPAPVVVRQKSFEQELFELMTFQSGRSFDSRLNTGTSVGWSRVVWDLLDVGLNVAFNWSRGGWVNSSRGTPSTLNVSRQYHLAFATSGDALGVATDVLGGAAASRLYGLGGDGGEGNGVDTEPDPNSKGISVILIELAEPGVQV